MRLFLITLLLVSSLFAQSFSTRYDVNVGMFGKVGYADLVLKEDGVSYEAKLSAILVGAAATLTGDRVETFTSKGKIVDGMYIPDTFVKTKKSTRRSRIQTYYFNHDKKEVKLIQKKTKLVSHSKFDSVDFQIYYEDVNETSKKETTLDDYIQDDVLSSYLNIKASCQEEEKIYRPMAVGAYNHENNITFSCLEGSKKESVMLRFSKEISNIYNLHVEPFDKDEETVDVLIAYDNDGVMKEAILGEVFWIGEITAQRVYHDIRKN